MLKAHWRKLGKIVLNIVTSCKICHRSKCSSKELLPPPIELQDVDWTCGDAELFESTFLPLPSDGVSKIGDMWKDVPWPNIFFFTIWSLYLTEVTLPHFSGRNPWCPPISCWLQVLQAQGSLGTLVSFAVADHRYPKGWSYIWNEKDFQWSYITKSNTWSLNK